MIHDPPRRLANVNREIKKVETLIGTQSRIPVKITFSIGEEIE
jgi:hypothetical protein